MIYKMIEPKKAIINLLAFFLLSYACSDFGKTPGRITLLEGPISCFDAETQISDSINLNLVDLLEDIQIVKLEMTGESIVGNVHGLAIGDGYILVNTEKDFFLFTDKGSFLFKPFFYGRGADDVIAPSFSPEIRDSTIIFCDESKHRGSVFSYHIPTRTMDRVQVQGARNIFSLMPDSDTTIYLINMSISGVDNFAAAYDFYFKRINSTGIVLDSFCLGSSQSFVQSFPSIFKDKYGICYISSPRGDSVFSLNGSNLEVVWRNTFSPYKPSLKEPQKISTAKTMSLGKDTILLIKKGVEVSGEGIILGTIDSPGKSTTRLISPEILIVDRLTGVAKVVKLFLEDRLYRISSNELILLQEGKVCIAMNSLDLLDYNNSRKGDFDSHIFGNNSRSHIGDIISENDNPYLIFGTIKIK